MLFVNILLSYISYLTEISNVTKERTEMAQCTTNISRWATARYLCTLHGFCRPRPSRSVKTTRMMRKMYKGMGECILIAVAFAEKTALNVYIWRTLINYARRSTATLNRRNLLILRVLSTTANHFANRNRRRNNILRNYIYIWIIITIYAL